MTTTLNTYFEFTSDDLAENRKGQLSKSQHREMQAELNKYRNTLRNIIAASFISLALFGFLLTINTPKVISGITLGLGFVSPVAFGTSWYYYTRLYRPRRQEIQTGKVGILKGIRPSEFVPFELTDSYLDEQFLMHKYESAEAILVIEDEVFALLDPDTLYNFYYWTAIATLPEFGNTILSLESTP